jgi:hypothetical protein
MTSDRQRAANRRNAKKSTGPISASGKRRSRENALRHGLAIDVDRDPSLRADVDRMAHILSRAREEPSITLTAYNAAVAEIDLLRISKIRASIFDAFYKSERSQQDLTRLNQELGKLDRYERRAFSRRRRALTRPDLAERTQISLAACARCGDDPNELFCDAPKPLPLVGRQRSSLDPIFAPL